MRLLSVSLSFFTLYTYLHPLPPVFGDDRPLYQGTGSCSSSNCHGSVNPIKGSRILQNEYYTWSKHDSHSKAYTALTQHDALRMAKHLGIGEPSKEPLCLQCHSTYVPDNKARGERYTAEDGVSCESCHGAAGGWISSHAAAGANHEQNLKDGLADTVNLEKRASLCLSCHFGDESKQVTHELYGAGHPRLRFELDTYGILQPKHWIVDEDYRSRKQDYVPIKAFLTGQAIQSVSLLKALSNPHTARTGAFPELSHFDCYSCHHSLDQKQWKERSYAGTPGRPRINVTPVLILEGALRRSDAELSTELDTLVKTLSSDYQRDGSSPALAQLEKLITDRVLPAIRRLSNDPNTCALIAGSLADFGSEYTPLKFEFAEQIGMGIQAALATSPELAKRHEKALASIFSTIRSPDSFSVKRFVEALALIR